MHDLAKARRTSLYKWTDLYETIEIKRFDFDAGYDHEEDFTHYNDFIESMINEMRKQCGFCEYVKNQMGVTVLGFKGCTEYCPVKDECNSINTVIENEIENIKWASGKPLTKENIEDMLLVLENKALEIKEFLDHLSLTELDWRLPH